MSVPFRPTLSVRELCLALAHRWEPQRLFMFVFTGYLDESGTHGGSAVTVMGGLLARSDQWERFEEGFAKAQTRYGFRVWHSKKFRNRNGDFKGWPLERYSALYWDLASLTSIGLTGAVSMTLNNSDFERFYRSGSKPKKAILDSKYGFCFRMCLYNFVSEVLERRYKKKVPLLHVVLEAGHPNYGDAERIFLEVKKEFEARGNYMLRTITKADKDSCGQLMMADFAAHSEYLLESRALEEKKRRRPPPVPARIPKKSTMHSHLSSNPETLARMRAEIVDRATSRSRSPTRPFVRADQVQSS